MNVLFLTTLLTLKTCNSPYMQKLLFQTVFCFALVGSYIFISDQKSRQKAIEIKTPFFIPLGIPRVAHWIIPFMLHISATTSPDTYVDELVEIFLKLPTKTVLSAFNYLDDFSSKSREKIEKFQRE